MRIDASSLALLKLQEDPLVSFLVALCGYGVMRVLVVSVFPQMEMVGAVWLVLTATVVSTSIVAAYRRKAALLWIVLLEGSGLGAVVVGFCFALYIAFERPSWLTTFAMLLCFGYTTIGILMVTTAIRIKKASDAGVPPNKSLERTREG